MTRISEPQDVKCCICNANNKVRFVYSTSIFSGPDLDTRPGFMARHNIIYEVFSCKCCGYCNIDLDREIPGAKKVIQSSEYQKQLKKRRNPEKANEFSCLAMIYESRGDIVQAGWQYLKAAWICDDNKKMKQASGCRNLALEKFQDALKNNKSVMKTRGEERLLFADIHRRTGKFNLAEKICIMAQRKRLNQNIRRFLNYEFYLCRIKDGTCHNVEDGMDYDIGKEENQ